jgi:hypothetical protein
MPNSRAADLVPVKPLADAFLASGLSARFVARQLGWFAGEQDGQAKPDTTRLKRTLGLLPLGRRNCPTTWSNEGRYVSATSTRSA